jgi:hypothetical protein
MCGGGDARAPAGGADSTLVPEPIPAEDCAPLPMQGDELTAASSAQSTPAPAVAAAMANGAAETEAASTVPAAD